MIQILQQSPSQISFLLGQASVSIRPDNLLYHSSDLEIAKGTVGKAAFLNIQNSQTRSWREVSISGPHLNLIEINLFDDDLYVDLNSVVAYNCIIDVNHTKGHLVKTKRKRTLENRGMTSLNFSEFIIVSCPEQLQRIEVKGKPHMAINKQNIIAMTNCIVLSESRMNHIPKISKISGDGSVFVTSQSQRNAKRFELGPQIILLSIISFCLVIILVFVVDDMMVL